VQTLSTNFLSSGDLIVDRRFEWARDREEKGDLQGAADLLAQALELVPGYASAWFALGEIREKLGDRSGAIEAFGQALKADPADRHGARLYLTRLGAGEAGAMPPAYLRALFDHYAPAFDQALDALAYRAPALLLAAVEKAAAKPLRIGAMLDLGCGTGLAGAAFRPHVDWLTGVDLSAGMVAQARAKGIYDRLHVGDILDHLRAEADAGAAYHLVAAADVLVYFHDLFAVVGAVARVLAPGGLFAFTTETHDGDGVILRETLRYAHGETHVRAALVAAGLRQVSIDKASTRTEKGVAVPGLVVIAAQENSLPPCGGGLGRGIC
jgi:predicted TPR repeat methyltransferase